MNWKNVSALKSLAMTNPFHGVKRYFVPDATRRSTSCSGGVLLYGQNSKFKKRIARRIENRLKYRHSVDISLSCKIGKGLNIAHLNGIVITDNCVIGDFADLKQGITIGLRTDSADAMIVIGDHVDIGCNSSILGGKVTIGNNVTIGAHSLVLQNIPSDTVYKNKITPVYTSKRPQPAHKEMQSLSTANHHAVEAIA